MKTIIVFALLGLRSAAWDGMACSTTGDCRLDECCRSAVRPLGKKRQLHQADHYSGDACQPRGQLGAYCLVPYAEYSLSMMYFYCPCAEGLTCKGTGQLDVPLGEMGACSAS